MHGNNWNWGIGMGMGIGMWWWIIGLIIVVAVVWMVVRGVNQTNTPNNQPGSKSALDILKERYARGEINKQEFEERRKGLM